MPSRSGTGQTVFGGWSNTVHAPMASKSHILQGTHSCIPSLMTLTRDWLVTFHNSLRGSGVVVVWIPLFLSR